MMRQTQHTASNMDNSSISATTTNNTCEKVTRIEPQLYTVTFTPSHPQKIQLHLKTPPPNHPSLPSDSTSSPFSLNSHYPPPS